jgi:hypothetical protein
MQVCENVNKSQILFDMYYIYIGVNMRNDQFNPHSFGAGAVMASAGLAGAMMASAHAAARQVRQTIADHAAAAELQEFFDGVHETVDKQEQCIAEQQAMIESLSAMVETLQDQLAVAQRR